MDQGWIKIHRQILNWEWYDEPNTFRVFFHLLLKANHKPNNYRGVLIEAGQIMTGFDKLASETSLSVQKVRTSLNRLKTTNEITINSTTKGTIIQIVNYKKYQVVTDKQQTDNKPVTNEQQTDNKPSTTNKNEKNKENEKKKRFLLFWDLYPKKINKKDSLKKWMKLSDEEINEISKTIKLFIAYKPFEDYTHPNPTTYLNQRRWEDVISESDIKQEVKQTAGDPTTW